MASTGYVTPGTIQNVDSGGPAWVNTAEAAVPDGDAASCSLGKANSDYLDCSNFGLGIPAGSTILNVDVRIRKRRDGAGSPVEDEIISLLNITDATDNKADVGSGWPPSFGDFNYGNGTDDLWGASAISASEINSSNFTVRIQVDSPVSDSESFVDGVEVNVDFNPPPVVPGCSLMMAMVTGGGL